ncbi:unnamed protein product [Acanthoscelides obtectus]|uniref:Spaetzle domain-containing protein n=1 Tax=Acanthoscelides obtectus TaxID=200917 RepID=A0A9P0K092_ACAOB|nr:unnamed protein product [Acanthoscelides obtectus]CAH2008789.1 unnamed protein product [Acanthoscelides obtectus]CAK1648877.1 hypothetical protein AOBTE_LOCUS15943 [Acanthoscelides obtectus]
MRIVDFYRALIAVLAFAAFVHLSACNEYSNGTLPTVRRFRRNPRRQHNLEGSSLQNSFIDASVESIGLPMFRGHKRSQKMMMEEEANRTIDCCPTVMEMVEPHGGKNQDGIFVELYRDQNYKQRFYELSCHKDVINKPCRFINKKLHAQSRCVQKHSYTYALVKDTPSHRDKNFPMFPAQGSDAGVAGVTYTLDYISVRSGCSCVVLNGRKKRGKKKHVATGAAGKT